VSVRWKEEPIARLRNHLVAGGAWTKREEQALLAECRSIVEDAAARYLSYPPPVASDMFDYLFEALPPSLLAERRGVAGEEEPDA
jgi:2-oxoisovalerate dehydrogenase E1 component alpha subunit